MPSLAEMPSLLSCSPRRSTASGMTWLWTSIYTQPPGGRERPTGPAPRGSAGSRANSRLILLLEPPGFPETSQTCPARLAPPPPKGRASERSPAMTIAPATVGVVGLGNMGLPMAGHLLAAGFGVRGYDVRREAVDALARAGGTPTASPAEAVAGAPMAITSLPSVAALQEVVGGEHGLAAAAPDGLILIETSTLPGSSAAAMCSLPSRGCSIRSGRSATACA